MERLTRLLDNNEGKTHSCEQHRDYENLTRMVIPFGVTLASDFEGLSNLGGDIND